MKNGEKFVTVRARVRAFNRFCASQKTCGDCPIPRTDADEVTACVLRWLALKAEDEKPLPCPFCGGMSVKAEFIEKEGCAMHCACCGFWTPAYGTIREAVSAHNRVARAGKKGGK